MINILFDKILIIRKEKTREIILFFMYTSFYSDINLIGTM